MKYCRIIHQQKKTFRLSRTKLQFENLLIFKKIWFHGNDQKNKSLFDLEQEQILKCQFSVK